MGVFSDLTWGIVYSSQLRRWYGIDRRSRGVCLNSLVMTNFRTMLPFVIVPNY